MKAQYKLLAIGAFTALCAIPAQAVITISFDYSFDAAGWFDSETTEGQERRDVLEAAADVFEARILDSLDAITPGGANTWTTSFTNPSDGTTANIVDPTIAADTLVVYAGARDLSGSTLGQGGRGGWSGSGFQSWFDAIRSRGQEGIVDPDTHDPLENPTDYALWGGQITFDTETTWHVDVDTDPTAGTYDLFSVAIHEIAHVLGMGQAGTWVNTYSSEGNFTGPAATAEYGGMVPLNPEGGHWAAGTMSVLPGTETAQEAAMDPNITIGTRKYFTELDWAGLSDVGWEISAVPEPEEYALFAGIGLVVFAAVRRSRNRRMAG